MSILVVLGFIAGPTVALGPSASAHKDTGSVAAVTGLMEWPQGPKPTFDLARGIEDSDLSLDVRAADSGAPQAGDPLNGCRLAGGNAREGLPFGTLGGPKPGEDPSDPNNWANNPKRLYNHHDLCFRLLDLAAFAFGSWEGRKHATNFDCISSGTTGASGALGVTDGPVPELGAFYGEFVCNGLPAAPGVLGFIPRADGHFDGLTLGGKIAFLGEVHCTGEQEAVRGGDPTKCPKTLDSAGKDADVNGDPVNVSRIKHTLACKGEVAPVLPGDEKLPSQVDQLAGLGNTVTEAAVALKCKIA